MLVVNLDRRRGILVTLEAQQVALVSGPLPRHTPGQRVGGHCPPPRTPRHQELSECIDLDLTEQRGGFFQLLTDWVARLGCHKARDPSNPDGSDLAYVYSLSALVEQ